MKTTMKGTFLQTTLTDGNAQDFSMLGAPLPATIWVNPAAGDTVQVFVSTDNGANFVAWDDGDVTAFTSAVLTGGVTNIRFKRSAGSGTTSTCGVC